MYVYGRTLDSWVFLVFKILIYVLIIGTLVYLIFQYVIVPAPTTTGTPADPAAEASILDKLGPRTATALIVVMIGLLAWVFWLFIHFGRRLSERGYLGALTSEALARAEISRIEDDLREDLRRGTFAALIDVNSRSFRKRYNILENERAPRLVPGVIMDELGNPVPSRVWDYDDFVPLATGSGDLNYAQMTPQQMQESVRKQADEDTKREKQRRKKEYFAASYQEEQLRLFREQLFKERAKARDRAFALLPNIDVSSFGGGWIFVLEFTTIIFIVFAALALGIVGVLGPEHIATILASIAGYVLGKSSTFRGPGGQEIVRGAEQPTAVLDALAKQAESREQNDEEKGKLQEQVKELQDQLAKTKLVVPDVIGKQAAEAESFLKEKELLAEIKLVPNAEQREGYVFDQSPASGTEVERGKTIILLVAKTPGAGNRNGGIPSSVPEKVPDPSETMAEDPNALSQTDQGSAAESEPSTEEMDEPQQDSETNADDDRKETSG